MTNIKKTQNIELDNILGLEVIEDHRAEKYSGGMFEITAVANTVVENDAGMRFPVIDPRDSSGMTILEFETRSESLGMPIGVGISQDTTSIAINSTGPGANDPNNNINNFTVDFRNSNLDVVQTETVGFGSGITSGQIQSAVAAGADNVFVTQGM